MIRLVITCLGLILAAGVTASGAQAAPVRHQVAILPQVGAIPASYSPATIAIKVGDTVEWTSQDAEDVHNVVIPSLEHASQPFGKGESDYETFLVPGVYSYYCEPHPGMRGSVQVGTVMSLPVAVKARSGW